MNFIYKLSKNYLLKNNSIRIYNLAFIYSKIIFYFIKIKPRFYNPFKSRLSMKFIAILQ